MVHFPGRNRVHRACSDERRAALATEFFSRRVRLFGIGLFGGLNAAVNNIEQSNHSVGVVDLESSFTIPPPVVFIQGSEFLELCDLLFPDGWVFIKDLLGDIPHKSRMGSGPRKVLVTHRQKKFRLDRFELLIVVSQIFPVVLQRSRRCTSDNSWPIAWPGEIRNKHATVPNAKAKQANLFIM